MTLGDLLQARAEQDPERPFLLFDERVFSYGDLDARATRVASHLVNRGVKKGDNVAVLMENCPEFIFAWFGIARAGAAMVPINPALKEPEIEYVREQSDSVLTITSESFAEGFEDDPVPLPEVSSSDLCAVVYTSGTTGRPKGAMLTHASYRWNAQAIAARAEMTAGDRFLCILPLFHVNAQVVTALAPLEAGGSMVLMRGFKPAEMLDALEATGATAFSGVPTVYAILNQLPEDERRDLSRLRFCICGAAPMPVEVFETFERRYDARILEGYGLTEATCACSVNSLDERKVGSIGTPFEGQEMRIEDGEILVRGPNVMVGYYRKEEATAEALKGGWLHTGDLGRVDADGYFTIDGRKKEMIIRGGENVYPREVEEVLYQHPAVAEAAVVGVPDAKWGEEVCAFVVTSAPTTEEEVLAFCAERLADFKCPRRALFEDDLPKTATGKVQKHLLRERLPG